MDDDISARERLIAAGEDGDESSDEFEGSARDMLAVALGSCDVMKLGLEVTE